MEEAFKIYKLTEAEVKKIANEPNEPHIHEFEELLVGLEGQLEHLIDFKSDTYSAPYVSYITKGKVHRVKPILIEGKCSVWVIRFSPDFIPGN
ncbi:MAG: AraC family transcriptional regulator, partial [Chloroflexota bacterium]